MFKYYHMLKTAICCCLLLFSFVNLSFAYSPDTTSVVVNLKIHNEDQLKIKVSPPKNNVDKWNFIVPQIVPGTYMKINYVRFYDDFKAVGVNGNLLKVRKKDNYIEINGRGEALDYLEYTVKQSLGDGKIWDNILTCAGTIYTDSSFLLNFQLVSGYFEGYQHHPFKVSIDKDEKLYGAGSLKATTRGAKRDVFTTKSYDELIDRPMLYAPADTASFTINQHRFHVAVHAEKGHLSAQKIKPALQRIMHAVDSFSGFTVKEDYYFILYYADMSRLKGMFKTFGLGSALEHNASSVYYYSDSPYYDSLFRNLDWIATHEYFHTISPLSLHSDKVHHFNFAKPDMSAHLWLYEGVTDYLSGLVNNYSPALSNELHIDISYALQFAEKRKLRSLTESSKHIVKSNMTNFISKILQLGNFYSKGKLLAFALDMELIERSNGQMRLMDVLLKMRKDYEGRYIADDELLDVLAKYTYPEIRGFLARYAEGKEIVPLANYFDKLGWEYVAKGGKKQAYGKKIRLYYSFDNARYYVHKTGPNSFGLKKGDRIMSVNGIEATISNIEEHKLLGLILSPKNATDKLDIEVLRNGQRLALQGEVKYRDKIRYSTIKLNENPTDDQLRYMGYFEKE